MDFEKPEGDVAEQAQYYGNPAEENELPSGPADSELHPDADPADLVEQEIVVPTEEDYEQG
ncbi:hypothetical protein [Actinopolyspora mortivallis]|uniref:hypothetical protein n=1 Tax=Actinopolyspora mortivallis TaxID=33906 RepID=UPI00037F5C41|nr:hypothetical protein [Actinopolyspora mortivallis]